MTEINFEEIEDAIRNGDHPMVAMQPDGRERHYGMYLTNYQNLLGLVRPAINEDLRNEGWEEEDILDFIMPTDEANQHPFINKLASAIKKAAQKGRFK